MPIYYRGKQVIHIIVITATVYRDKAASSFRYAYSYKYKNRTDKTDSNGLSIGAIMNNGSALGGYWKGVFYKLMFYTKTIDQLSINMLKNLFERDELIDITNPIFKKKEL